MAPTLITLDTSGLFALLNRRESAHASITVAMRGETPPRLVPAATLGELTYLVEERLGAAVLVALIADLRAGHLTLDCGEDDLERVEELVRRYADLPLGFVDAAVIACTERNGGRVLTLDRRHFGVVGREGTIVVLP